MAFSDALQDFALKVSINIDSEESKQKATLLAEEIEKVLNDKLSINGKQLFNFTDAESDLKKLTEMLGQLGSGIRSTFADDESKVLSTFAVNFENLHKGISTVLVDFKEFNKLSDSISERQNMLTNLGKNTSVSVTDKINPDYQLKEMVKDYQRVLSLSKEVATSTEGSNTWSVAVNQLKNANSQLEKFKNTHQDLLSDERAKQTVVRNEIQLAQQLDKIQAKKEDQNNTAILKENESLYNQTLSVVDKIYKTKIQMVKADESNIVLLKQQLSTLEQQKNANLNSGKLTLGQTSNIGGKSDAYNATVKEYSNIVELGRQIKEIDLQEIENENKLKQLLNERVNLVDKINTLKLKSGNDNQIKSEEQSLIKLQEETKQVISQISNQGKLNQLIQEYSSKISNIVAKNKDLVNANNEKEDTSKINQTISAYNKLIEAKTRLFRLKDDNASNNIIARNVQTVDELQTAYNKASSAILSNNTAVSENEKVIQNCTLKNRELADAQEKVETGVKQSTVSVNSLNLQFRDMVKNVFQYKILADVYQNIDTAVTSSIGKVKELNDAMTQVRLVTGENEAEAQKTIGTYADLAKQLNTTTKEVADGSIEWFNNIGHYKSL